MSTPPEPTLPPHSETFLAEINAQLKQRLDATTKELEYARLKIRKLLEERLHLQRIEKYGPGSEKLSQPADWSCWSKSPGSAIRKWLPRVSVRTPPPGFGSKEETQAPRPPDAACGSAACGADNRLHVGTVCMRQLRRRNQGVIGYEVSGEVLDVGAGALFCAGDQTRKAGVQKRARSRAWLLRHFPYGSSTRAWSPMV